MVGIAALGESAVRVAIKPWVAVAGYGPAQAELNEAIVERFRVEEIPMPVPRREVRLLNGA